MSRDKEAEQLFHNDSQPMSLGCANCLEREVCGGLHALNLFDCTTLCCEQPATCEYVCIRDMENFIARFQEVKGFDLKNISRVQELACPILPFVVPMVYHSSSRVESLKTEAVAIQLSHLFDHKTGSLRFKSREEVAYAFGFDPNAQLVIIGVDKDAPLETYWLKSREVNLAEQLRNLEPALLTSPNFSVFLDAPRWDNLYNIKRIAICWSEFIAAGIPTSIHLNGRTDRDWERWIEFVAERPEVKSVAFEFATGAARDDRGEWHVENLIKLASLVQRDLQLIVRGGLKYLTRLYGAFNDVAFIDTTSFMKSVNRFRLYLRYDGKSVWKSSPTEHQYPIDDLLQHNVEANAKMIAQHVIAKATPF